MQELKQLKRLQKAFNQALPITSRSIEWCTLERFEEALNALIHFYQSQTTADTSATELPSKTT